MTKIHRMLSPRLEGCQNELAEKLFTYVSCCHGVQVTIITAFPVTPVIMIDRLSEELGKRGGG